MRSAPAGDMLGCAAQRVLASKLAGAQRLCPLPGKPRAKQGPESLHGESQGVDLKPGEMHRGSKLEAEFLGVFAEARRLQSVPTVRARFPSAAQPDPNPGQGLGRARSPAIVPH